MRARNRCFFSGTLAVALFEGLAGHYGVAQKPMESRPQYLGPGSCSATACHGGIQPKKETRVLQNEYTTWVVQDKHAQSYKSLLNPISQRMGKVLGIGRPEESAKCLVCHALYVPPAEKGREFDISEGVSCESCHGPSSLWLGTHTLKGNTHAQSVSLGLVDTKPYIPRAEKCLSCHLGSATQQVDHEMIAAGHPDLVFELDSYSAVEPPHWKAPDDPADGARAWSVGQAVQLRESLKRLARRAQGDVWPEYSEYECFACHHPLGKAEDSWRQARGYPDRRSGNAPWNSSHFVVFRVLAREMDPAAGKELEDGLASVYRMASSLNLDRKALADSAEKSAAVASRLAASLQSASFPPVRAAQLLKAIAADADRIAPQGPRAAEQAVMAMDSLFIAYAKATAKGGNEKKVAPEVRSAINDLFKQLENPSLYNGPRFAASMRRAASGMP